MQRKTYAKTRHIPLPITIKRRNISAPNKKVTSPKGFNALKVLSTNLFLISHLTISGNNSINLLFFVNTKLILTQIDNDYILFIGLDFISCFAFATTENFQFKLMRNLLLTFETCIESYTNPVEVYSLVNYPCMQPSIVYLHSL